MTSPYGHGMHYSLRFQFSSMAMLPSLLAGSLAVLLVLDSHFPQASQAQTMPGGTAETLPLTPRPAPSRANSVVIPETPVPLPADLPYTLGAGDIVRVDLFRLPQYSGEFQVQIDGSLTLPLVGSVSVQDLSLDQAAAAISERYAQVLRRPIVSMNLLSRRALVIGVAGEVNRPGSYALAVEGTAFPKLTQLFEAAGGITQSADLRQVQIRRQVNGQPQLITANLWQLLNTGDLNQDINLRDGDSIFIPSTLVPLNESQILADASFSSDTGIPISINVTGEVFRPGPYTLRGGSTRTGDAGLPGGESGGSGNIAFSVVKVTDAISIAGGIKPKANIREVQVRRITRQGTEEVFSVDLWSLLQAGDARQNAILQEGDTIFIPTATAAITPEDASQIAESSFAPNTIRINVVGEVRRGGLIEVPPNTPLNQGILAAGGFNDRARQDAVGLIRVNPDGTVIQQEIAVNFAQGINDDTNPVLQNNDIVLVGETAIASFSDNLGSIAGPIADFLFILGAPFRFLNFFD